MTDTSYSFFFHRPDFIFRKGEDIVSFSSERSEVGIHFTRTGSALTSVDKSPFGGFIFGGEIARKGIVQLVNQIVEWALATRIERIVIKCFPQTYAASQATLTQEALLETGFIIKYKDIAQVLPVYRDKPLSMNIHRKRRLRNCIDAGFKFRKLSFNELPEAYSLFTESRQNKGYPVTMSLEDLAATIQNFPDNYTLSGVFDGNKMIAAAVSIVVNTEIMYCFYIGDLLAYRRYSPVTMLVAGIYESCSTENFKLLDLGISTDKGELNQGLHDFKKSLGCEDSLKLTFEKIL